MVKHTQTIRRQIAEELFEYIWPFCEIGVKRVKLSSRNQNQSLSKTLEMSLCIILKKFQIKMIIDWNYIFNVPGRSSEKLQKN